MKDFDSEEAKKSLIAKEQKEKHENEGQRQATLQAVVASIKEELSGSGTEAYLVGSIIRPFHFSPRSDVDIVLKNYTGDRFDFWTKLEEKIKRPVEIILFETCPFQEFVLRDGLKVYPT